MYVLKQFGIQSAPIFQEGDITYFLECTLPSLITHLVAQTVNMFFMRLLHEHFCQGVNES